MKDVRTSSSRLELEAFERDRFFAAVGGGGHKDLGRTGLGRDELGETDQLTDIRFVTVRADEERQSQEETRPG
jgi:hypothetical protein